MQAVRLAEYLQSHPNAIHGDPAHIAQEADVRPDLVLSAFSTNSTPRRRVFDSVYLERYFGFFDRIGDNVSFLTLGLSVLALLIGIGIDISNDNTGERTNFAFPFLMASVLVHLAAYLGVGQLRAVIRGSLGFYGVLALYAVIAVLTSNAQGQSRSSLLVMLLVTFGFLMALYLPLAFLFSVAGEYARYRSEQGKVDRLDRQGLLDLLFDVQNRLKQAAGLVELQRPLYRLQFFREVRDAPYLWSLVLGLGLGAVSTLFAANIGFTNQSSQQIIQQNPLVGIAMLLLVFLDLLVLFILGFAARSIQSALLSCVVFGFASYLPTFLPIRGNTIGHALSDVPANLGSSLILSVVLGALGGISARLEERTLHRMRVEENDPRALLNELVTVQRRLTPGERTVVVMVVDAAKSSQMKADADPFIAEWSFRAYQQFLEKRAQMHEGKTFATAGDGATFVFEQAANAAASAKLIQQEVDEFNATTNKLSRPFQLRIGIHCGTVRGHLADIQYAEVIDIAAHIEAACKLGGIAVSEPVWDELNRPSAEKIEEAIDGYPVWNLS